jgi:hypothetical protein
VDGNCLHLELAVKHVQWAAGLGRASLQVAGTSYHRDYNTIGGYLSAMSWGSVPREEETPDSISPPWSDLQMAGGGAKSDSSHGKSLLDPTVN